MRRDTGYWFLDTEYLLAITTFFIQDQASRIELNLSDDTKEALLPDSLFVGKENVLYCKVKSGLFPARFNRAAYYQLAEYIEEEGKNYFLPLNGRKYVIRAQGSQGSC